MTLSAPTATVLAAEAAPAFLAPTTALVVAAAVVGYFSVQARVVPIVGFLLAGVLIGPHQLGLVPEGEAVEVAAEVGVILLLFTIGIEFSLERLASLWRSIVIGGGLQVALTTLVTLGAVTALGASWQDGVFTGFLVSLSSTAIVLKLLADRGEARTRHGQLAVAVLVFQDLAVVAMVLVLPELSGDGGSGGLGLLRAFTVGAVVVAVVLVAARRLMPPMLERVARTCSQEVFLLAIVAVCFGTAWLTALAGVSVSLGAFLAGLVVSESRHGIHAVSEVLPLQILFAAAFFVSVGMLLDVGYLLANLPLVIGTLLAVLVVKVVATSAGLALLRVPWRTAAAAGLLLGQVGEFSFVLLTVGVDAGLSAAGLGDDGTQAVVAGTVLLMALTPVLAAAAARLDSTPSREPAAFHDADDARSTGDLARGHVVLLGWGPGAAELSRTLRARGRSVVVTTLSPDRAAQAESLGARVVRGDSIRSEVLRSADVASAALVVVAEDSAETTTRVVAAVRRLTQAPILARPTDEAPDVPRLSSVGADRIVDARRHGDLGLAAAALQALGETPSTPRTVVDVSRVVQARAPEGSACRHLEAARPVLPSAPGCEDCLREGHDDWVHLRVCLGCGHVGCCDSSPGRHSHEHADEAGHPLMASAEPDEDWAYCYLDETTLTGARQYW